MMGEDNQQTFVMQSTSNLFKESTDLQDAHEINDIHKNWKLESIPDIVLKIVLGVLDFESLIALERVNHVLSESICKFWKEYCVKRGLTRDPTPICVGWNVNPSSKFSYDKAVEVCNDPIKKWRVLAVRNHLKISFKCVICEEFLRDMCGVNGVYLEHDILLCHPRCMDIFLVNVRSNVVGISSIILSILPCWHSFLNSYSYDVDTDVSFELWVLLLQIMHFGNKSLVG